jgi:hypothetical protein
MLAGARVPPRVLSWPGIRRRRRVTLIDVLIVAAFILYVVMTGFRDRRLAAEGPEQYFLAGGP